MRTSTWATKITDDNFRPLIEYGARFNLNLYHQLTEALESNAANGEDTWLMVFGPEDSKNVAFDTEKDSNFVQRYMLIPLYHPEGHLQAIELNA